jgi:CHAT domain-containing protein
VFKKLVRNPPPYAISWGEDDFSNPYFWAAFTLTGQWN